MRALIVSDNGPVAAMVRQLLLRDGCECPAESVVSLKSAAGRLPKVQVDLVVVVLAPDLVRAQSLVEDLRSLTTARILAVGPVTDSKFILRTLGRGADVYVDQFELETDLETNLWRLKTGSQLPKSLGRMIVVLGPSGGCGSSTLAVNIATVLAKEHSRVALLDLKLTAGDLAALLDLRPVHTLADLCLNGARVDRAMFERSLTPHASGVQLLAAPQNIADIAHVNAGGIRQAVTLARSLFPYVVVDLDHSFQEEQVQELRHADSVVLIMRLDFNSVRQVRRTLDHLQQLGVEAERVHIVVNRHGQVKEVPPAKAEAALGHKIFHYVPDDPKTINRANNDGIPVVLESPKAAVSKSVIRLAMSLNGQHTV